MEDIEQAEIDQSQYSLPENRLTLISYLDLSCLEDKQDLHLNFTPTLTENTCIYLVKIIDINTNIQTVPKFSVLLVSSPLSTIPSSMLPISLVRKPSPELPVV